MNDKELDEMAFAFFHLNTQLKHLGKLKDKMRDELKEEMKLRKADILDIGRCRIDFSSYERTYQRKDKVDSFIIESGEKLEDYYYKKKIEKLQVVKTIDV